MTFSNLWRQYRKQSAADLGKKTHVISGKRAFITFNGVTIPGTMEGDFFSEDIIIEDFK